MRIGFDISQTGKTRAGCGFVAYSLIRAFAELDSSNEYILYTSFGDNFWDSTTSVAGLGIKKGNFKPGFSLPDLAAARQFWRNPPKNVEEVLGSPDIIHSNNFYCPSFIRRAKIVYTLHDLAFLENPEHSTEENRISCFNGVYNASLHADAIIAVSEYSRQHFLRVFPHYPPDRIYTAHLGSRYQKNDRLERPARLPEVVQSDQFWLTVGTLEPRKNHRRLLEAYALLKQENRQLLPIVHAGGTGWLMDDFSNYVRELGLENDVLFLGYVDDVTLQWLYQNCFAFLYPSLFEGFGLPVLEAMSLGACVIASHVTSIPEIVGDAGLLVDPKSCEDIAEKMAWLLQNPDERVLFRQKVLERAKRFDWRKTAQKTLEIYQKLFSSAV